MGSFLPRARRTTPATTQTALTFDDNRRASTLFGQYGQNLAMIERRLGRGGGLARQPGHHRGLARWGRARAPRARRPLRADQTRA
jgi:phosphate starvation-inducible PhoH-like protein